jgi:hypothetical protein
MAKKLQEAEETIQRLQGGVTSTERPEANVPAADTTAQPPTSFTNEDLSTRMHLPPGPSIERNVFEVSPTNHQTHSNHSQDPNRPDPVNTDAAQDALAIDLSVDEHGKICYYGPTSAVHEPLGLASPSTNSLGRGEGSKRTDLRSYLVSRAKESAIWEEFALGNASLQLGLPRQVMAKLLHLHWTWVAPMFMWVYRPAFMRMYH